MPNPTDDASPPVPVQGVIKEVRKFSFLVLAVVIAVCLLLAWNTRGVMSHRATLKRGAGSSAQNVLVEPWQTAVDLASFAVTAEEQRYAETAQHLADHDVHQAFAAALAQAQLDVQKRQSQPEARRLALVVEQRQQTVNQDQDIIKSLAANSSSQPDNGDLDLTKAQLDLDSDELKDAQQALTRALEDERPTLEQQLATHEDAVKKYEADLAAKKLSANVSSQHYGTLVARMSAWFDQRSRYQSLLEAADQTDTAVAALSSQQTQIGKSAPAVSSGDNQSRMNAMKSASMRKRMLMIASDRMQNQKLLSDTYRKWAAQVQLQHQIVFHLLMTSVAVIAGILITVLLLDTFVSYFFAHDHTSTRWLGRYQHPLRVVLEVAVQVVGAILVFLLIFGQPSQLSTIIGLTTAGLTVVLQDFIISFCGWFVLMGKHGIRVGDWVEIDGITGEVANIGIFRTALLETGNWTEFGQPTGRRITFANSFAIRGQYFNFTTSGQWLWDEFSLVVPVDEAYANVELILKSVLEETKKDSEEADEEWRRSGRVTPMGQMNAEASVNMRPASSGVEIVVRYVTRAAKRAATRNLLHQLVLDVLHQPSNATEK